MVDAGCPRCAASVAAHASGALPAAVPLCAEHGVPGMRVIVSRGPFHFYGVGALLLWLLARAVEAVGLVLFVAVTRPRQTAALLAVVVGAWLLVVHPAPTVAGLIAVTSGFEVWSLAHPASWRRWGRPLLLGMWRRVWLYRRLWSRAMHAAGLERIDVDGAREVPRLGRVRSRDRVDVVAVRGLLGQRFGEWEEAAGMLGHAFGATDVRVHRGDDRRLTLELVRGRRGRSWNRGGRLELEDAPSW